MLIYKHIVHAALDSCNLELGYYWIIARLFSNAYVIYIYVCVCVFDWPHELGVLRKETCSMRLQDHKANQNQDRNSDTPLRKVWISRRRLPQNSHSF